MRSITKSLLVLSIAVAPSLVGQDPTRPEGIGDGGTDIYGRPLPESQDTLREKLVGCWQISRMNSRNWPDQGRRELGFMVMTEDHLSMQVRAMWDSRNATFNDAYEAYVAEYRLGAGGTIQIQSLMGSFLDRVQDNLEWEAPGKQRQFRMSMPNENSLLFRGGAGEEISFVRANSKLSARASIYGVPDTEASFETDIFGRPLKKGGDSDGDR